MRNLLHGLYGITDSGLMPDEPSLIDGARAALSGGMRVLQYRDKHAERGIKTHRARLLRELCDESGALLIINDDVELAAECAADGIHLGRDDTALATARRRLGDRAIVGASCYNQLSRAVAAAEAGCDYVAFGRFFPSLSKPNAVQAEAGLIEQARRRLSIPLCAIGGITLDNVSSLVEQQVDMVAVIQGLFATQDIEQTARRFSALFRY
jgi:thiamine-phosphate pyrophosphorylase